MLNEVDKEHKNVLSLEDPIEYSIDSVSQSQVHPEINYTFATGLRTTLRKDPDIIMVGEIRDKETAQLAVQAALTGYLVAPTLILAMAQRLVGVLAPGGGKLVPVEGSIKMMIEKQFADLPPQFK